jgi:hypothetical protein
MKAIKPRLHALAHELGTNDTTSPESTLAPLHSRTGKLWLLSSCLSLAIGAWLLVAAPLFGVPAPSAGARSEQTVGALTILVTLASLGRRTRPVRMAEIALGAWLVITTWFASSGTWASRWNATACGLALIILSAFLGKRRGM